MKFFLKRSRTTSVAFSLLSAVACGGGSSPVTPPPITIPPTTVIPGPTPTPPVTTSCPLGFGSGSYRCVGDSPGLMPQLQNAVDKLVKDQPQLFDTTNPLGTGGFLIYNVDAFYAGVIANLQAEGLCGQVDDAKEKIAVKENNSYSENYDIVSSQNRIRRGNSTFLTTCYPANFPLSPDDAVATVAVSFFRIANCPAGVIPPALAFNRLPVGCVGTITATPRDASGNKLPIPLHGTAISWYIRAGEGTVIQMSPDPDVTFNQKVGGREVGEFSVCAVVQEKTGCVNGAVIP
jgi:hypothetical protein